MMQTWNCRHEKHMKHMKQDQVRVSLIPIGRTMLCIYIYIYMIYVCTESVQKGTNLILAKAATCGHLLWPPLAATCGHLRPLALAATCGHLRPLALAATCGHSSGCKWLPLRRECWRTLAATCGHSSGCKWLQVAAALLGGEYWEFSVACARKIYNILRGRSLGNVKYCTVLISMLREFLLSEARPIWNVLGHVASRSSLFSIAVLSSSFNKSFLLIASPSFSFKLVRFRCGSFPVVPSLLFFVAALSASFNKSFLLIASPSFSFKLVRFRCGSFPVVPSLFFFVAALSASFNKSFLLKLLLLPFRLNSGVFGGSFPAVPRLLFFVAALSASSKSLSS